MNTYTDKLIIYGSMYYSGIITMLSFYLAAFFLCN